MKRLGKVAALLITIVACHAGAQSASESRAQDVQARGFWSDPSTGLMWAAKDNGHDVTWKDATKYCRDLRLAGYSDWRLASVGELQGIYDKNANAPGLAGSHGEVPTMWHVKGNLFLTGNQWSSTRVPDDRGRPSGYAYRFDFNEGQSFDGDELYFHTFKRALCVRAPGK
jgi:hypothetical protein